MEDTETKMNEMKADIGKETATLEAAGDSKWQFLSYHSIKILNSIEKLQRHLKLGMINFENGSQLT